MAQLLLVGRLKAYLPVKEEERHWSDRQKTIAFPLFEGYLFARIRLKELHEVLGLHRPWPTACTRPFSREYGA